jgi:hypothetical protein
MNRLLAALVLGTALAAPAHADVSAAARAFSDGQAAQLEGNYDRAAQSFELAYNIAPSREALRSAVRARQLNSQLPRAATLAQVLATRYGDDAASAKLAADVLAEAKQKLARIVVTCAPQCTLAVGGRAVSLTAAATQIVFATPGHQSLEATFEGDQAVTREITVRAGDDLTLPIEQPPPRIVIRHTPPAAPAPAPPHRDHGLSPAVAITGGAVTLVLGSLTVWSGLDTQKAHEAYVAAPSDAGWNEGRSKQLRTNVLLAGTGAAGLTTGLIAIFWTRWSSHSAPPEVAVAPIHGGVSFALGGHF